MELKEQIQKLREQNNKGICNHKKPRGDNASEYDCTDLHIGYDEAISDVLNLL